MKLIQILIVISAFLVWFAAPAAAEMEVVRASVCTGIEDREPVGLATTFSNVERLYFFSEIIDAHENTAVKHIWYLGDRKMLEVELAVSGSRWRTWSYKNIHGRVGDWRADVVSAEGDILKSVSFTVR